MSFNLQTLSPWTGQPRLVFRMSLPGTHSQGFTQKLLIFLSLEGSREKEAFNLMLRSVLWERSIWNLAVLWAVSVLCYSAEGRKFWRGKNKRELVREISQWNLQLWITSACELIAQQCIIVHFGRSGDKPRAAEIWAEYWCWTCN